ncbi:Zinc/iron permease [Tilletiaria anomala UBC 951]|uniref:Zinc/iron permease n=1 Tax=Tilletiaria anomala (strain ATCC 24038 / CBS 436.72 / UBC 951) TaxID=1037660 RepID=A0A066VHX5_TILAU|nr:Zinc/iron permease [Tilletiaria anomala UBC 951]KDN41322.1 Zinc/iron permease [Tilletiaria anomala UBC 951]
MADSEGPNCYGPRVDAFEGSLGLRIGAIFVILATSLFTTLFPVVTRRVPRCSVPRPVFDFAKYFGSGVIIATAFMHLLSPGVEELHSECLSPAFQNYDFAFAFAMISMFMVFIVELIAFRVGSSFAQSLAYDPHKGGHHHAAEHSTVMASTPASTTVASAPTTTVVSTNKSQYKHEVAANPPSSSSTDGDDAIAKDMLLTAEDPELAVGAAVSPSAAASQILGVMILEFGVIFHSVIIGITLGTTSEFTTLFIVIIFHQMFEGLGLGARLAFLPLHPKSLLPFLGATVYACVTPLGLAIGLGIRHTYNEDSATANYITGTFDSVSAGILLYTGLVELLAHEFIFNERMRRAPIGNVLLAVGEMLLGAGVMALLARWA